MSWLSYIYPQTVIRTSTKYNQDIRVNEEYGRYKLLVNGSRQSGTYIEMLWKKAFDNFEISSRLSVGKILVLGVAGGTVIHLLHTMYPKALIKGVDIDQKMIDIGLSYFKLKDIDTFSVKCADARTYITKAVDNNEYYDVIIVDLFSGRIIPDFVKSDSFLKDIFKLLNPSGFMVVNYLRELEYRDKAIKFKELLRQIFGSVKDFTIERNRVFYAYR